MINRLLDSLFSEFFILFKYARSRDGFKEAWPIALLFISIFLTSLIPHGTYIYQMCKVFTIGGEYYTISYFDILIPFLMAPVFFSTRKNWCVLGLGISFIILGLCSAPYAQLSASRAISCGIYTALPLIYISCIRFSPFQKDLIKWASLILCLGAGMQVILYGLGVFSYISDMSGETVGVIGSASRVSTTLGAATGTAVFIFLTGVLSALLFVGRPAIVWSILLFIMLCCFISQSRGALVMSAAFCGILLLTFTRDSRSHGGGVISRVGLLIFAALLFLSFYTSRQDLADQWQQRIFNAGGNIFDSTGRDYRFVEAYNTFVESNFMGIGMANYLGRQKFTPGNERQAAKSSPHNVYLLILAETGFLGICAYIVFLASIAISAYRYRRYMCLGALIVIWAIGHNVEIVYVLVPFLWIYGLLLAYASHRPIN